MAEKDKHVLFEQMGGRPAVEQVTIAFYKRIYSDPWLKQFFDGIPRAHIESQQNEFMQAALGGFNRYAGKTPPSAHQHIFITQDVYDAREAHLLAAFAECNTHELMVEQWLKVDATFHGRIVKQSKDECIMRYPSEGIRDFQKP
jgi:truncated hemoglobin YjbI